MRKLFLGSVALTTFSISLILFQISCRKEANAQDRGPYVLPPATTSSLGGVMPDGSTITVDASGKISAVGGTPAKSLVLYSYYRMNRNHEFWIMNLDGSNKRKINIVLPAGIMQSNIGRLTPDGKTLVFEAYNTSTSDRYIYSIDTDGTNLKQLVAASVPENEELDLLGTY